MSEHARTASRRASEAAALDPALRPRLVVTDLDGSLLDHDSYDFSPARTALSRLKALGVPVIPVTSKTRAELAPLREALGLTATPFVAENGAVIGLPPGWCHPRLDRPGDARDSIVVKHTGVDNAFIRARLDVWRRRLDVRFTRMGEMSVEKMVALTGLDDARAIAARKRQGSEPLIWEDDAAALDALRQALAGDGLTLTQGGRFHHAMGATSDKGRAVEWLIKRFRSLRGSMPLTLGLGDGPNDIEMLEAVDQAVVIKGAHHLAVNPASAALYRTRAKGPTGWVEGLVHWWGAQDERLASLVHGIDDHEVEGHELEGHDGKRIKEDTA
ncbi:MULTISPECIES: mannosyl-3-phosphoglycerate phosphatase [unclassified Halomonas]|uniref:HAD-IIB family hydrolase n=1 Tax=unclassified Halomonas TaxID=2609666 RepID=UPI00209F13D5|nr:MULTISPECIES: HAD-IIB family hydrolase [unclassified Halomonas]MCP1314306.1 HAD-IIB family hydrolase [Halomonas sp. 707D7]MCP1327516.1 HAD-IIB family hydrolase [Halomonas sp. 707D4]